MFEWRLKLREARQAMQAGRYDDARRVLSDGDLREFLPAKQLAGEVAVKIAERGRQRIAWGESGAGFDDLKTAERLGGDAAGTALVRHEYAQDAAQQALERLVAGEPVAAQRRVDQARRRGIADRQLRSLADLATLWVKARQLADAGEMRSACEQLDRVSELAATFISTKKEEGNGAKGRWTLFGKVPFLGSDQGTMELAKTLGKHQAALAVRTEQHTAARNALQQAIVKQSWDEALRAADEALRLAPADRTAQKLRRRVWKQVGLDLTQSYRRPASSHPVADPANTPIDMANDPTGSRNVRQLSESLRQTALHAPAAAKRETAVDGKSAQRQMLWVDAVGGYMVCMDDEIVLGQPAGSAQPAVPILADLSRRHAVLRREGGNYVLEPLGPVKVDGRELTGPAVLDHEHLIELGPAVRLRFTRPHALSATARLVIESGHRTVPAADAVLLMAESCIMGAASHSHIQCRDWKEDVILFRKGNKLACRTNQPLELNGTPADGPAELEAGSRVEGEDFALSVERC